MSLTIELLNDKIVNKIVRLRNLNKSVQRVIDTIAATVLKDNSDFNSFVKKIHLNLLGEEIDEFENYYGLSMSNSLAQYYINRCHKYEKDFFKKLNSENIISKLEDFELELGKIVGILCDFKNKYIEADSSYIEDIYSLEKCANEIKSVKIQIGIDRNNFDTCKCGKRMEIIYQQSKLLCECGIIKDIFGVEFEENQINNMTSTKDYKKTNQYPYDPIRHYRFWMERIQAKENKNFPADDLKRLEMSLKRDGIKTYAITCELIRRYLKECRMTHYNNNVPLLVKLLSNKSPPQFTPAEHKALSIKFFIILEIYEKIRSGGGNRIYCPYFIYKICEQEFANNPQKLNILKFIHLQSRDTLKKNDLVYKQICERSNGILIYQPTKHK